MPMYAFMHLLVLGAFLTGEEVILHVLDGQS